MSSSLGSRSPAGRVYDRGYRPYEGDLGGRSAARAALWRASVRRALGIRRSWRQKLFPWLLLGIATLPAIINVGISYATRDLDLQDQVQVTSFREYMGVSTALLVFMAITGPDVLCPERRSRVLPLIFARPLTGADYVLAKFGAIAAIVFAFGVIPQSILFTGQALVSDGALDYVRDNADVLWKVPVAVGAMAAYYASLVLAMASFTTRRIIAAASLLILLLVLSATSGILTGGENARSAWALVNILAIPFGITDLVFLGHAHFDSPLYGIDNGGLMVLGVYASVVAVSLGVLFSRYRYVEA